MARFCDVVGYVHDCVETRPGIYEEQVTERRYYGDEVRAQRKWTTGDQVNDKLDVSLSISIVADGYAYENLAAIRYVKWHGALWTVNSIDLQRPRLILSIGGAYNGPTAARTAGNA